VTWRPVRHGRQHRAPTNTPQSFSRGTPSYAFSKSTNMCKSFWHTPKISQKFAGEWNFGLQYYSQDVNRTGCHSALVHLNFAATCFKVRGNVNIKHLKIPETHRGPHETPSRAACLSPWFKPWIDHQWRLLTEFLDFSLLFRSIVNSTSQNFDWKIAFVLHHIKNIPKSTRCFFWSDELEKTWEVAKKPARASKPS